MSHRQIGAVIIGFVGTAILLALGVWQVQRLEWKRAILTEMETRIAAAPSGLPAAPDPEHDRFLPIEATGRLLSQALRVVTTDRGGAAYRVISPFEADGRRILLDRGVIPADATVPPPPGGDVTIRGNLHWPDETDSFTPPPEPAKSLWYARDVAGMAAALDTEPLLVVATEVPGDSVSSRPLDARVIPNDHLEYALTWFSLAAIWAGMTAALVWRIRRRID